MTFGWDVKVDDKWYKAGEEILLPFEPTEKEEDIPEEQPKKRGRKKAEV